MLGLCLVVDGFVVLELCMEDFDSISLGVCCVEVGSACVGGGYK